MRVERAINANGLPMIASLFTVASQIGCKTMTSSIDPENCNSATENTENTERFKDLNHHIVRTRLVNQDKDPNP
ncbi:MAG: hypothetical protein A3G24_24335 [Betaproteobacteria bacterium RIFCSPLOWO2_12_FULL_62_13]|nr:MAG: hypothetical protein A3G24_24335 [Betaproteobacteria bacterium RIFCSPLOWO2_12_FULL_62_13]